MPLKDLKDSIANHGQIEDVIEANVVLPGGRVVNDIIVSGYKRSHVISSPKKRSLGNIGLAKYIRLLKDNAPVKLTAQEKKLYVESRAREFVGLGMTHKQIMETLKKLTGLSDRQLYKLIPDDCKDPTKQAAGKSAALMQQKREPEHKEKTLSDFSKADILDYMLVWLDAEKLIVTTISDREKAKLLKLKDLIVKWCG